MLYFTLQNQRRAGAAVAASGNFCSVFHDPPLLRQTWVVF